MKTILEAKNLRKVYGSKGNLYTAIHDISLNIKEGDFIGIMGPSGSGKTTLLNVISTIDTPTSGNIFIDNTNILNMNEDQMSRFRRDKLGFIFQDYNLLDTLTVKENIILPLALSGVKTTEIEEKLEKISSYFSIQDILNKYPYDISGGQKQRTAACRAIITNPSLILADEPTGALDSKSSAELLQCLSDLNEKESSTIMMVTHDTFAASFCKKVIFIKDGLLYTEIMKGNLSRKDFFHKIIDVLSVIGGGNNAFI